MSYEKKYTVARYLSEGYGKCTSPSNYLMDALMNMMTEMRNNLAHVLYNECHLRWVMTHETFNWIVCNCSGNYSFDYEAQFNYDGTNKYTIYDIEVEFVDDDLKRLNAEVDLIFNEPVPDKIKWNLHTAYPTVTAKEAIESMPWFKDLQRKNAEFDHTCIIDPKTAPISCVDSWNIIDEKLRASFDLFKSNICDDIKARKENKIMPIYVGYGKKVTIENVIFNNPATIVFWSDGTKTVVKRQKGDKKFDPEKGLAMAICKKVMGNKGNFNDIFKEWIEED